MGRMDCGTGDRSAKNGRDPVTSGKGKTGQPTGKTSSEMPRDPDHETESGSSPDDFGAARFAELIRRFWRQSDRTTMIEGPPNSAEESEEQSLPGRSGPNSDKQNITRDSETD